MSQQATGYGGEKLGSSRYIAATYKGECDVWGVPKLPHGFDKPSKEVQKKMEQFLAQMARDAVDAHWHHHYVKQEYCGRSTCVYA